MSNFEMDWGSIKESGSGESVSFLKLQNGLNQVRVASRPSMIEIHWEKSIDGQQKKVICLGAGCPICKAGHAPMSRYQVQVIDRADGKIKIMEGGPTIFNAIKNFAMDPDYGDPTKYDLKIKKEGSGRETKYTVLASPKKFDISADEKTALDAAKSLAEINKAKTLDEIMQLGLEVLADSIGDLTGGGFVGANDADISDDDWNAL